MWTDLRNFYQLFPKVHCSDFHLTCSAVLKHLVKLEKSKNDIDLKEPDLSMHVIAWQLLLEYLSEQVNFM